MSGGWKGSNRKARLPRGWDRIRKLVLVRDPTCQICKTRPSTQVDHVRPKADDHSHLQGVCYPCHKRKSSSEGGTASAATRPSRHRPPEQHPGMK
ncbi:HNH endonuclease signature motif containing protein [Streptomyces gardneri]|uniref:HNH endonuclease signature motif containing protein n=1 Tax=Streptomyces gardneri TaxID=66892 RepID=UPI0035DA1E3D